MSIAGISVIDLAVVGLLLISFTVGILRGLQKSIDGMFGFKLMVLSALVGAYLVVGGLGATVSPLAKMSVFQNLSTQVETALTSANESLGADAMYEDGVLKVEKDGAYVPFTEAIDQGTGAGDSLSGIIEKIVPADSFSNGQSIANYLASKVAQVACMFVLFLVLCIINRIILGVISKKLKDRIQESSGIKKFDKLFGAFAHLTSSVFNIIVIFYVLSMLSGSDSLTQVTAMVQDSIVGNFFLAIFVE